MFIKNLGFSVLHFCHCLEGCGILDDLSKLLWFRTYRCTTVSSASDDLDLSPSEIKSFHCIHIGDSCFLVKNSLITVVNFKEICSLPDKFKCWPCSVKYFLSLCFKSGFNLVIKITVHLFRLHHLKSCHGMILFS